MDKIRSNIVKEDIVRRVQQETLDIIADSLNHSFGPNGSTTAIVKMTDKADSGVDIKYTKDGHTIIKNMQFLNSIERSVQVLLTDLTHRIVRTIGDGTTSAIILCAEIFKELSKNIKMNEYTSSDIIADFNEVIKKINERILNLRRDCTLEDIYNICLISTNNNIEISKTIFEVYKKFGLDLYIDVGISSEIETIVKEYDGMTLETGYANNCFVNDPSTNMARIPKPRIYCFEDPIDTPEMVGLLNTILDTNIVRCYRKGSTFVPVPTVIFCKKLTKDSSSYFETIVKLCNAFPGQVPLLIVSDIHQDYLYEDIAQMCGARFIKKYLNPDLQQKDIEAGLAPTVETICDFCGYADEVRSDPFKTQVIKPMKMFNADGTYSDDYNTMLRYLKTQIAKAKEEDAGIMEIARAKKRYNSFKGCMVDLLIGGVTLSDREALKTSVDDAILNCRSAVTNGVGYGSNFMAFKVISEMREEKNEKNNIILDILYNAYIELIKKLYKDGYYNSSELDKLVNDSLKNDSPLNIRTNKYDKKVLSSIKTDTTVLDTVSKIITLMFTTNQYLVPTPAHQVYDSWKETLVGNM